jgi:hypothetical protein
MHVGCAIFSKDALQPTADTPGRMKTGIRDWQWPEADGLPFAAEAIMWALSQRDLSTSAYDLLRTFSFCRMKPCEESQFQANASHAAVLCSLWRIPRTRPVHFARFLPMGRWRVVSNSPRPPHIRVISRPHTWCPHPVSPRPLAPVVAWSDRTRRYPIGRIRLAIRCQQLARTWLQGRGHSGRRDQTNRRRTWCRSYYRREKSACGQTFVGAFQRGDSLASAFHP